jgi:hypothetical protein
MHNAIPLILAALMAVGIIVIGCFYLVSPEPLVPGYVLKDVVSGLVVLTMMLAANRRLVGIALIVEAILPFGDMSIILGSGGSKSRAFSVHGVTCAAMLVVGLLLIHVI